MPDEEKLNPGNTPKPENGPKLEERSDKSINSQIDESKLPDFEFTPSAPPPPPPSEE